MTELTKYILFSGDKNSAGILSPYDPMLTSRPVVSLIIEHQTEHEELSVLQSKDSDHSVDNRAIVAAKLS